MKIVILGLLGNIAIFLLYAFAHWNINPAYWVTEWRTSCAFLMGAITFIAFAYFIIEYAKKEIAMTWIKIDRDENGRITDDCYYAMLDSLDEHPCFVVSADLNYCDYLIVTQLMSIGEWYDLVMANPHYTHYLPIPKLEV